MARLLVTGGAGFIGANFVHYWLDERPGDRLVVLDALTYAGNLANLEAARHCSELRFIHGSICDEALVADVLREERIDTIVHFAAESHVDRSIQGPDAFIETNIVGTHALLKAARSVWIEEGRVPRHRFHQVSTDEVFGALDLHDPAFHERTPYAPRSPYSASKAGADHLVRAYHHTYGLQTTTSHCSNNYGPFQFPEKLIPLAIVNLLRGRPLPLYGDGRNVRDWLHVRDHCRGIELILSNGRPGEVYNIGGGSEVENIALIHRLCEVAEEAFLTEPELRERFPECPVARGARGASLVRFVTDRPGHDRRYAIDCSRMQRELGYRAQMQLDEGLRATFAWYLRNEPWWQAVLSRMAGPPPEGSSPAAWPDDSSYAGRATIPTPSAR